MMIKKNNVVHRILSNISEVEKKETDVLFNCEHILSNISDNSNSLSLLAQYLYIFDKMFFICSVSCCFPKKKKCYIVLKTQKNNHVIFILRKAKIQRTND